MLLNSIIIALTTILLTSCTDSKVLGKWNCQLNVGSKGYETLTLDFLGDGHIIYSYPSGSSRTHLFSTLFGTLTITETKDSTLKDSTEYKYDLQNENLILKFSKADGRTAKEYYNGLGYKFEENDLLGSMNCVRAKLVKF